MSRPPHTALAKARTVHSKDRVRVKPSAPTEDLHTTYITPAPSTSATRDADLRKSTFHEATFARESWWTVSTLSTCGQHLGPISEISISTCGQHLGGRSPTSNINISVDPKPHPAGALIVRQGGAQEHAQRCSAVTAHRAEAAHLFQLDGAPISKMLSA